MANNLAKIVDDLSALTVLEAAELSKLLEEKWGVSAAAPAALNEFKTSPDTPAAALKVQFPAESLFKRQIGSLKNGFTKVTVQTPVPVSAIVKSPVPQVIEGVPAE